MLEKVRRWLLSVDFLCLEGYSKLDKNGISDYLVVIKEEITRFRSVIHFEI